MFKNIILFPSKYGQRLSGVEKAPDVFKGLLNGNIKMVNCSDNLENNLENLYKENMKIYSNKVNIGGDHSMSLATVASTLRMHNNVKVLWFDAHGDINTRASSKTKNLHGMPLGFLTKLDQKSFNFIIPRLNFKNIMYIGIRELDEFESEIIKKYKIKHIKCGSLNRYPKESLNSIKKFINNDPVHLSFDVDVLDPVHMQCTGTKCMDGLTMESAKYILDGLKNQKIVNMDITELNLELGSKKDQEESIYNYVKLFEGYLPFKN